MKVGKVLKILGAVVIAGVLGLGGKEYLLHQKKSGQRNDLSMAHKRMLRLYVQNGVLPSNEQLDLRQYSSAIFYKVIDGEYLMWNYGFDEKDDIGPATQGKNKSEIEQMLIENSVQDAKGHPFYWFGDRDNGDMFIMKDYQFSKFVKKKEGSVLEQLFCMIDPVNSNETENIEALLKAGIKKSAGKLKSEDLELLTREIYKTNPKADVSDIENAMKNNFDAFYSEAVVHYNNVLKSLKELEKKKDEGFKRISKDMDRDARGNLIIINRLTVEKEFAPKIIEDADKASDLFDKALSCDKNNPLSQEVVKYLELMRCYSKIYRESLEQTVEGELRKWR